MSTVLVTGGAGFVGSHLCQRLLTDGHGVYSVDNYYTGARENNASLESDPRFKALHHDVTSPLYVEVDQIYNLGVGLSAPLSAINDGRVVSNFIVQALGPVYNHRCGPISASRISNSRLKNGGQP